MILTDVDISEDYEYRFSKHVIYVGSDKMKRSFPIVLACILLPIPGVIGIIIGAILVGTLGGLMTMEEKLAIMGSVIVWGGLATTASYGLWKLRKWRAYVAVVLSLVVIGLSIGLFLWSPFFIVAISFFGLIIILVATGWKASSIKSSG